jgi:hypothetical protein
MERRGNQAFGKNVVAGGAILTALRRVLTIPLKADDEIAG